MILFYARVLTKTGEVVHLAKVATKYRSFSIEGLKTLCGHPVDSSIEGDSDAVDCLVCLKIEKKKPLARSSMEDPHVKYTPTHRRPSTWMKRILRDSE